MAAADKAMYLAKAGLNKAVCLPSESRLAPSPLPPQALINELQHAIENREFVMLYQPKIHLKTYQILGVRR